MTKGIYGILAVAVLAFCGSFAAEGDAPAAGGGRRQQGGPGGQAALLLKHADELGLTAEQKAKLEEFAKGPLSVLTDAQKEKAKAIVQAARPEPGARQRKGDAAGAKPDGDKKPEDKKPDEKKPDGDKKEEKKDDK